MRRSRFTEEQIIAVLREQEDGVSAADVCRRHEIKTATFLKWKSRFGGMDVSSLRLINGENALQRHAKLAIQFLS